jgi:hypothetical protein
MRRKKKPAQVVIGHIYRITFPNGKIYIGQDRTDDICYFGSACRTLLTADFTKKQRKDFTIRKELVEELVDTTIEQLNLAERSWIERCRSYDPAIGYNRTKPWQRNRLGDESQRRGAV